MRIRLMRFFLPVALVTLAACASGQRSSPDPDRIEGGAMREHRLAGGWSRQDPPSRDAQAAVDWVLGQMNTSAALRSIREVRTQVVAGLNYAVEFELDNGEVWHTIVFRDLEGNYHVTQQAQLGVLPDPYKKSE